MRFNQFIQMAKVQAFCLEMVEMRFSDKKHHLFAS